MGGIGMDLSKIARLNSLVIGDVVDGGMQVVNVDQQWFGHGKCQYLPMSEMNIDVNIVESVAVIKMVQNYYNPAKPTADPQNVIGGGPAQSEGKPIEVNFKFPKEPKTVVSSL